MIETKLDDDLGVCCGNALELQSVREGDGWRFLTENVLS